MIRLLFGLGLGYLIGTLFAPGKGSETREVIRKKFDDVKEELAERGQGARVEFSEGLSRASDKLAEAQEIAAETVGKLDKNIHDIAKKGKDIVS